MVEYERRNRVAVISIDRPERRNAVDRETALALRDAWERFEADDAVDVGILPGRRGTFSAGADLKAMDLENDPEGYLGFTRMSVSKPTIAAIEGYCVAGGLETALWCDIRVAARSATFGCFERRFGVPLVDGGTQRLPRIVGLGRALDMILTGDPINAETAESWGLITRLTDEGDALEVALDVADTIASAPQQTVKTDRAAVYNGLGKSLDEGLALEEEYGANSMETAHEGAARFAAGEGRGGERPSGERTEGRKRNDDR